jgi:hypothetical protein
MSDVCQVACPILGSKPHFAPSPSKRAQMREMQTVTFYWPACGLIDDEL